MFEQYCWLLLTLVHIDIQLVRKTPFILQPYNSCHSHGNRWLEHFFYTAMDSWIPSFMCLKNLNTFWNNSTPSIADNPPFNDPQPTVVPLDAYQTRNCSKPKRPKFSGSSGWTPVDGWLKLYLADVDIFQNWYKSQFEAQTTGPNMQLKHVSIYKYKLCNSNINKNTFQKSQWYHQMTNKKSFIILVFPTHDLRTKNRTECRLLSSSAAGELQRCRSILSPETLRETTLLVVVKKNTHEQLALK